MMRKMSSEKAVEHIDFILGKVSEAKSDAVLGDATKTDVVPGTPAGTTAGPVSSVDTSDNQNQPEKPKEGEFSAEKEKALKEGEVGVGVEGAAANGDGHAEAEVPTDFGAGPINKKSGEGIMSEQARIQALGAKIEEKLMGKSASAYGLDKLSAEETAALQDLEKLAQAHYEDYMESFYAGMAKKAEDVDAVVNAKGVDPETASDVLDEAAQENPELVIPEGGDEDGGEELSPEDEAQLAELADQLEAQGVTPEELASAVADVADEDSGEGVAKAASERQQVLKDIVRGVIYA